MRVSWRPVATSQMTALASQPPVTTRSPDGEKAADQTALVCPASFNGESGLSRFQSLIVLSTLPVMIHRPSGEKATALTWLLCPLNSRSSLPEVASQRLAVLSPHPVRIPLPSGETVSDTISELWVSTCKSS